MKWLSLAWVILMCEDVYDQHPDHMLIASAFYFAIAVWVMNSE